MDIRSIAYFSMEIALDEGMPTYSGGLGILAGDTIRSAADLRVPMVGVTLIHRKGYFYQRINKDGWQSEEPSEWAVNDFLIEMKNRVNVTLEGRSVSIRCWKYEVTGITGFKVPVYFLDTDVPENSEWDRRLTHFLYGGDQRYRLCQEAVLGVGGVRMLGSLGHNDIKRFHMNEGHASLLILELLENEAKRSGRRSCTRADLQVVREKCVFTTHTPVPAGHDQFGMDLVTGVLGRREHFADMKDVYCADLAPHLLGKHRNFVDASGKYSLNNDKLNMTYLALNSSRYVNGVARKHAEVAKLMFAGYEIDAITNGVHVPTWISKPFRDLFDRYIPHWKEDNSSLRSCSSIPKDELWQAHVRAKKRLLHYTNRETNSGMDKDVLTIGFARRATAYKRGNLIFRDIERLKHISSRVGLFQLVFSGKAHPQDEGGKEIIRQIFEAKKLLKDYVKVAYLENYDIDIARMMISGVDVWLNTPKPPLEASGTSGMKAALNGVPSFSILDGWWIEGHIEGVTGWSIGEADGKDNESQVRSNDALSLYGKLEDVVIPVFYQDRDRFIEVMRNAVALNGSFFNTQRMLQEYVSKAYVI